MITGNISEILPTFTIEEDGSSRKTDKHTLEKLKTTLSEIYEIDGVLCTLVRNSSHAYINVRDNQKMFDLAMLTEHLLEFSERLLQHFGAETTKGISCEGKNIKILFLKFGEIQLGIFMRHEVDYCKILEKLSEHMEN